LGCNGIIDVLIEPAAEAIKFYEQIVRIEKPVALATIFSGPFTGEKFWIDDLETRQSRAEQIQYKGETADAFLELIQPGFKLIIFGGGFDARPVSQLAKSLGWEVEVTDECAAHIAPLFFPTADKLSLCQRQFVDRDFNITPYTACVLMSHNYEYDRDVMKKLVNTQAPYIGIMGPRKRFEKMLNEGLVLSEEQVSRVHSPIGLDIGAEAPDEIAVAIISEIQARFSNRDGSFLKNRSGAIHQRDSDTDQVYKQVYFE
jgi:xanthine/CO dehydrogenase XdhC/CoxF family maturation factor